MGSATITAAEKVPELRLDHNAGRFITRKEFQLLRKPLAGPDDGEDEILESLPLHRHGTLVPFNRVISGRKGTADYLDI